MLKMLLGLSELILLYVPLALGIVIVFRIAKFPDLTIDGSFATGAVVTAVLIKNGYPYLSLPMSVLAGMIAGFFTATLHIRLGIDKVLAGILVMTALYSVDLNIMNSANLQFTELNTSLTLFENIFPAGVIVFLLFITLACALLAYFFLRTEVGLHFRAGGENIKLIRDLGRNQAAYLYLGPIIANSLVGLSGGLVANYSGYADVNMGSGQLIAGLAILFIGRTLLPSNKVSHVIASAIVGTIIFEITYHISLSIGLSLYNFKLLTSLMVILFFVLSRVGKSIQTVEELF